MSAFKPALVTNLHGDCYSAYDGSVKFAVGFEYDGARYHIWFRDGRDQERLYKNALVPTSHPEYFNTRQLDLSKSFGLAVLTWLEPQMKLLEAQAKATHDAEIQQAREKQLVADRAARVHAAGPVLLERLQDILHAYESGSASALQVWIQDSRALIAKVTGVA